MRRVADNRGMEKDEIKAEYDARLPAYQRATANVREALELFLSEYGIPHLAVLGRVKEFESLLDKTASKGYSNPFSENTDFIGLRVIVYYPTDIAAVLEVLQREFDVIDSEDKADSFDINQFGYRSHHVLVKIKQAWLATPNYRGLDDIPIEIQLRTVLMHAWAEIEHKLQYKSKEQVPRALQRQLFLLSAKFEEADGQFQALKVDIDSYRKTIAESVAKSQNFDTNLELNLDTFKELLRFFYPANRQSDVMAQNLFETIQNQRRISLSDVVSAAKQLKPYEQELQNRVRSSLSAAAMLGYALELFIPGYWDKALCSTSRNRVITEIKEIVETKPSH